MAGLLLDSHVLLWIMDDSPRCGPAIHAAVQKADLVLASVVSLWELQTKKSLGKLKLADNFFEDVGAAGFETLPVRFEHIERYGTLPFHHRDPFDRMLVAQSLAENLTLVTADNRLAAYGGRVLLAA